MSDKSGDGDEFDQGGTALHPVLDIRIASFLSARRRAGLKSPHALSVREARAAFAAIQANTRLVARARVDDLTVENVRGGRLALRIVRPLEQGSPYPAVVYLHGGCWVMGHASDYDRLLRHLAVHARAALVFVNYTLAPEARHDTQVEQAYAAVEYVSRHERDLDLDASRLTIAGDCTGAGMAAQVALLAKSRRGPDLAFQLLICPTFGSPRDTAVQQGVPGEWLRSSDIRRRMRAARVGSADPTVGVLRVARCSIEELNDLPEALVIVAEHDVARDDGEDYARRLIEAGVPATSTRYVGAIHDFVVLNAIADAPTSRRALEQSVEALRSALYG